MLRIVALLLLFALVAPVHLVTQALLGRSRWPRRFLWMSGWIVGLRVRLAGRRPGRHSLLVANHTSWLDIVLLGGSVGSAFVSKDELGHPLVHWLADQNGTVYVKRSHRKGAKDQAIALARALQGRQPVTVFAEGTVGPGTHLLPFRSTLLEAANFAARDVNVRPIAIDYGAVREEIAWFQEPGLNNFKRILSRSGSLPVTIHVLEPLDRSLDRKQLAHAAREAISDKLDFKSHEHSPIGNGR